MIERLRGADREDGFSLVELLVTIAVMGIVVTATFSVLFRAYKDNSVTLSRTQAQNDGRVSMERMSKQIRQATNVVTGNADQIVFDTYLDGAATRVEWKVTSTGVLQTRVGTTGGFVNMAEDLEGQNIFTYRTTDALDEVVINMKLGTESATIPLSTTVALRNSLDV